MGAYLTKTLKKNSIDGSLIKEVSDDKVIYKLDAKEEAYSALFFDDEIKDHCSEIFNEAKKSKRNVDFVKQGSLILMIENQFNQTFASLKLSPTTYGWKLT